MTRGLTNLENHVQTTKNNVDKMRDGPLKKMIEEKAKKWKELQKKNAIALTEIYDREQQSLQKLEARYAVVANQYESVSSVCFSYASMFFEIYRLSRPPKNSQKD